MKSKKNIRISTDVLALRPLRTPEGRKGKITLDLNEAYGTLSPRILKKISPLGANAISSYPEYGEFTIRLARVLRTSSENIYVTNGSDEAIKLLIELLFRSGDRVILPVPTFFIYNHFLAYKKVKIIETPYLLKKEHYAFPTKDILLAIRKGAQGVVICNPGNPIGVSASKKDLLAILRATDKKNIPFIVDEAYFEYCGFSLIPFIHTFPNLIVLRTFSKAYGLAGMRVGYVVSSTRVIDALTKIRLPWNVNHLAIEAASIVLEERPYILKQVKEQKKTLLRIAGLLRKKGLVVHTTETNFILVQCPDAGKITAILAKHNLLVKNLTGYPSEHGLLENVVRISVPAKKDLKTVVSLFSQYL